MHCFYVPLESLFNQGKNLSQTWKIREFGSENSLDRVVGRVSAK